MSSKIQESVKVNENLVVFNDLECASGVAGCKPARLGAISTNIQESFDEIDIFRGTVQYWESRGAAIDPMERHMLAEAFRIMHGELLGLTARMKELLDRIELAVEV